MNYAFYKPPSDALEIAMPLHSTVLGSVLADVGDVGDIDAHKPPAKLLEIMKKLMWRKPP